MKDENYLALWMSGSISDEEVVQIDPSVDLSVLKTIKDLTKEMDVTIPQSVEEGYKAIVQEPKEETNWMRLGFWSIAATLVGVLLAATIYLNSSISIESGSSLQQVILPDQTVVTLMPGAELSYKRGFNLFKRNTKLKGEAQFQVTKGRPFTVFNETNKVEVLGTIFRVISSEDGFFQVSCTEGKVRVNEEYILTKGKFIDVAKGEVNDFPVLDNDAIDDGLYYYQTSLSYILALFELIYDIPVTYEKSDSLTFTGVVPLNDKEKALEAISLPFGLSSMDDGSGGIELR